MGRPASFRINESLEDLEILLKEANEPRITERLKLLISIKENEKLTQQNLSKRLKISNSKLKYWMRKYNEFGLDGFTSINNVNDNRKSLITKTMHLDLEAKMNDTETPITSFKPLIPYLKEKYDLEIGYPTLSSYMIRHFGKLRDK